MNNLDQPKVSVFMITYNHEKFIRQAIESVLNQTYANIELVIGEDYSTDNTRDIVLQYAEKFPNKIKPILNEQNVGMHKNTENVIRNCNGKYVALIEGDDYWTDERKLEKQVAFLEENEDYSICFHRAKIQNESKIEFAEYLPSLQNKREEFTVDDFIDGIYMPTASTVFRNQNIQKFPSWYFDLTLYIDRMFHLINGQYGKIKFMNDCMSVYRVHEGGFWSISQDEKKAETLRERIFLLRNFNEYSQYKYKEKIEVAVKKCEMEIVLEEVVKGIMTDQSKLKQLSEIIEKKSADKPIYIFGTGRGGKKAIQFFNKLQIECKGFLDNDSKKWGTTYLTMQVHSPTDFNYENKAIFISSEFHTEISVQLESFNLVRNKDYFVLMHLLMEGIEGV